MRRAGERARPGGRAAGGCPAASAFHVIPIPYHTVFHGVSDGQQPPVLLEDREKALYWQMTVEYGLRNMKMHIEWAQSCIDRLRAGGKEG